MPSGISPDIVSKYDYLGILLEISPKTPLIIIPKIPSKILAGISQAIKEFIEKNL